MRTLTSLSIVALITAAALLHGCQVPLVKSTTTATQSTAHIEGTQLVVQGVNGAIEVIAEPGREDVQITATITAGGTTQEKADERLAGTNLIATRDTNRVLTISTEFPEPSVNGDSADLTIRIPAASDVSVTNTNGSITIIGLDAALTLKNTNGRVTVRDASGEASVTTVNGRIEATVGSGFAGEVEATTGNGSITISDPAGILQMQETDRRSGRAVFATDGEHSTLRTSNGSIRLTTR